MQRPSDSSARKFDEYVVGGDPPPWTQIDRFVKQLRRERGKRAYIIVYTQRKIQGPFGYDGEDWKRWVYHNLKARGLSEDRFTTVNGGLREVAMMELWIIGRRASLPVPTPTATEPVVCPHISAHGDIYVLRREQPLLFSTHVSAWSVYSFPNATFHWTVSAGRISSGQGTKAITVDASQSLDSRIEATVKVGGLPGECRHTDSATTDVFVNAYKIDEFGSMNREDNMARLDNLALNVHNDATLRAHIIVYGGRHGKRGEAEAWGNWMRSYLVNSRGLWEASYALEAYPDRKINLVIVDGGYREERSAELWLVPLNHAGPAPSPSVDPKQVDHENLRRP